MFNFEKLEVWHKAIDYADDVYTITRVFRDEERFGLTSQMRRAAVSISSNIAEGTSRHSRDDYAHFLEIATGSIFEVVSQATISKRQGFLNETDYKRLYEAAESSKPHAQRLAKISWILVMARTLNPQHKISLNMRYMSRTATWSAASPMITWTW